MGVPTFITPETKDAILQSATKKPRQSFSEWTNKNLGAIEQLAQVGVGIAGSIATTAQQQKFQADQNKIAIGQMKQGQYTPPSPSGGGMPPAPPAPPAAQSDTILGMSKPLFFGVIGVVVIVAGVGIYLATKGGGEAAAK